MSQATISAPNTTHTIKLADAAGNTVEITVTLYGVGAPTEALFIRCKENARELFAAVSSAEQAPAREGQR